MPYNALLCIDNLKGSCMEIKFNKKEYRLLLDMLMLANWVMHGPYPEPTAESKPYYDLQQKICAYAEEMGVDHLLEIDEETDDYIETEEYMHALMERFIIPHEDETFWGKLSAYLARRDLINELGQEKFQASDEQELVQQIIVRQEHYDQEFNEHGIDRLNIVE
jgi:hypothetical protein